MLGNDAFQVAVAGEFERSFAVPKTPQNAEWQKVSVEDPPIRFIGVLAAVVRINRDKDQNDGYDPLQCLITAKL